MDVRRVWLVVGLVGLLASVGVTAERVTAVSSIAVDDGVPVDVPVGEEGRLPPVVSDVLPPVVSAELVRLGVGPANPEGDDGRGVVVGAGVSNGAPSEAAERSEERSEAVLGRMSVGVAPDSPEGGDPLGVVVDDASLLAPMAEALRIDDPEAAASLGDFGPPGLIRGDGPVGFAGVLGSVLLVSGSAGPAPGDVPVNRPGFCIRSSQSLEGSRDASTEGLHA